MSCGCGCVPRFQRANFLSWLGKPISGWPFQSPAATLNSDNFAGTAERIWQPSPGSWAFLHSNSNDFFGPHPDMNGDPSEWSDADNPSYTKFNFARGVFDLDDWTVTEAVTIEDDPDVRFEAIGVASIGVVSLIDADRVLCAVMVKRVYQPWWPGSGASRYENPHMIYGAVFTLSTRSFGPKVLLAGSESYNPSESTRFQGVNVTAPLLSRRDDGDWDFMCSEEGVRVLRPEAVNEVDEFVSQPRSRKKVLSVSGTTVSVVQTTMIRGRDHWGSVSDRVVIGSFQPEESQVQIPGGAAVLSVRPWGTPLLRGSQMPTLGGKFLIGQRPWVRYNRDGFSNILNEPVIAMIFEGGLLFGSYPVSGQFLRPVAIGSSMISTRGIEEFDNGDFEGTFVETWSEGSGPVRRLEEPLIRNVSEPHPPSSSAFTYLDSVDLVRHDGVSYLFAHSPELSQSSGFFDVNAVLSVREFASVPGLTRVRRPYELWRSSTTTMAFSSVVSVLDVWGPWKMSDGTDCALILFWRRTSTAVFAYGVFLVRFYERPQEISGKVLGQRIDFEGAA